MSDENGEKSEAATSNNVVDFAARRKLAQAAEMDEAVREVAVVSNAAALLSTFAEYIDRGMVMVTIDATLVGVSVPPTLRGNPQLNLNFSHRFFLEDFVFDERGVRASLSFGGVAHLCDIPWSAVWMLRSHADDHITLAPSHVPEALRAGLLGPTPLAATPASETPSPEGAEPDAEAPPGLRSAAPPASQIGPAPTPDVFAASGPPEHTDESSGDDDEPPPSGRPVLKLVKG